MNFKRLLSGSLFIFLMSTEHKDPRKNKCLENAPFKVESQQYQKEGNMKRILFLSLSLFILMFFTQTPAFACVCTSNGFSEQEVKWNLKRSDAVFTGEVIEITRNKENYGFTTKLKIERSWKDYGSPEIEIFGDGSDCEYYFTVGRKYLVYASEWKEKFITSQCVGNRKLEEAGEQLKVLGQSSGIQKTIQKRPDSATLAGDVYDTLGTLIVGAQIRLEDEQGKVYQTVVKEDGYQLNVPTGLYFIEITAKSYETFRIIKYRVTGSPKGKQTLDICLIVSPSN